MKCLSLILSALLTASSAQAAGAGSSTANFLKMGVGGRGVAMGEAQTAAVNDATSLYWNPAGLAGLRQNEVSFMHNTFVQGINHDVLYYAHPTFQGWGTLGAGLSLFRVGDVTGYDTLGVKTGELTASDTLLTLGWGKSWERLDWFSGLHTGVSVKFLQKKLADDSASAFLADGGLLYEAREGWAQGLKTGVTILNMGQGLKFIDETDKLPRTTKLGLAYPFFGDHMTVSGDYVLPSDNDAYFNLGGEYKLWDIIALRLGYNGQNDADAGLTYGVGFGNERLRVDYALVPFGKLGDSHRVSVGFRFGQNYRKTKVEDQIKQAYEKAEARYAQGYLVDAYIQASEIKEVAPWHRPSRLLLRKIQKEFKDLEDEARREQLQVQIDDHFSRGEQHFQMDELIPAKREFETILALQPNHIGARTYLKRIDERFASLVQTFYESGMRYFAAGDYKLAKEQFEKVLVVDPNHTEAREQLTRAERLLNQAKKDEDERIKDESIRPVYHDGLTAFQQGNYLEALNKFEEVLRLKPDHPESIKYRGVSRNILAKQALEEGNRLAQEGDWKKAAAKYKESLRYNPDQPEVESLVQETSKQLGQQRKEESQNYYKEGLEAFLAGNQDKAAELWQKAVDMDPENMDAVRGLERLNKKRGAAPAEPVVPAAPLEPEQAPQ